MEKPGMGRRSFRHRAGLLILLGAFSAPAIFSQTIPTVLGEASPASPLAGSFWTVTLLVDHPAPEELEVHPPPLPQGLTLDQTRAEPRVLQSPASESTGEEGSRRWTALQYRFIVRTPGRIDLSPFEILVNGTSVLSPSFSITVRPLPEIRNSTPLRLFWRDLSGALTVGEEARLALCISGQQRPELPAAGLPLPPVPPKVIMEAVPLQAEDEVLALRVIPLEGPAFILPAFSLSLGNQRVQIPSLRIPVLERSDPKISGSSGGLGVENSTGTRAALSPVEVSLSQLPPPPFPLSPAGKFQERARGLWEGGQIVEALAELRRNERDHPAGFILVNLRREAEQALGLEPAADEVWRPRALLVPGMLFCLILAALGLTLPALLRMPGAPGQRPWPPQAPGWVFKAVSIVFTVIALFCLFRLSPLLHYRGGETPRQALARETVVYRVPDDEGAEITRFREGQMILVYGSRDGWVYAESTENGQGAGWIRTGSYLIY